MGIACKKGYRGLIRSIWYRLPTRQSILPDQQERTLSDPVNHVHVSRNELGLEDIGQGYLLPDIQGGLQDLDCARKDAGARSAQSIQKTRWTTTTTKDIVRIMVLSIRINLDRHLHLHLLKQVSAGLQPWG